MSDSSYDKPPETMYKYTSFKNALNILTSNKIYFAHLSEFNDPFDGRVILDIETPENRKVYMEYIEEKARKRNLILDEKKIQEFVNNPSHEFACDVRDRILKENLGFCCLTDTCQSLPMWAHYAGNHTGCCLVLDFSKHSHQKSPEDDFPFYSMKKIKYRSDLPKYNMNSTWLYYVYKSREWEYENEWRAVMFGKKTLRNLPPDSLLYRESNGKGLYPLGNFLHGVILGHNMEYACKKDIKDAASQCGISVQQASPEVYKYGMCST